VELEKRTWWKTTGMLATPGFLRIRQGEHLMAAAQHYGFSQPFRSSLQTNIECRSLWLTPLIDTPYYTILYHTIPCTHYYTYHSQVGHTPISVPIQSRITSWGHQSGLCQLRSLFFTLLTAAREMIRASLQRPS
jgi:hypothetical protein